MGEYSTLQALCQAAKACTACDLSKQRTQVVPGEGDEHAEIMFIGEGPGYHEDQQGRPFVGPAGKLLDEMIASIGLKRQQVYIANVVKCRPPGNRDPLPGEIEACRHWLEGQIELINPKVIVTLGRHSMGRFITDETITRAHGKARMAGGRLVFPVHHPAAALYQGSLRKTIEEDFRKLPALLDASSTPEQTAGVPQEETKPTQLEKPKQLGLF